MQIPSLDCEIIHTLTNQIQQTKEALRKANATTIFQRAVVSDASTQFNSLQKRFDSLRIAKCKTLSRK